MKILFPYFFVACLLVSCDHDDKKSSQSQEIQRTTKRVSERVITDPDAVGRSNKPDLSEIDENKFPEDLLSGATANKEQTKAAYAFVDFGPIEECKEILEKLPAGPLQASLLGRFCDRYTKSDIDGATAWILSLPEDSSNVKAFASLGKNMSGDVSRAMAVSAQIKDKGIREKFGVTFLLSGAKQLGPEYFKGLFSDEKNLEVLGVNPEIAFDLMVGQISTEISSQDSVALATSYLQTRSLSDSGAGYLAMKQMMRGHMIDFQSHIDRADEADASKLIRPYVEEFASKEPIKASEWLVTKQGPVRDQGAAGLVAAIAATDPRSATQWALSVTDPQMRSDLMGKISRASKYEREAVIQELSKSNLPEAERESLVKLFQ